MRPPKDFPANTAERMRFLLRRAKDIAEQRRIQAVLMRASDALPPTKIAELTGLSVHSVRVLHSRFLREGEACVIGRPGRGGRRRTLLTAEQTKTLLDRHAPAAAQGGIVVANVFKRDYEQLVGHKVALSSIYLCWPRLVGVNSRPGPVTPRRIRQRSRLLKKLRCGSSR